jgi:Magnesium chelatase, subunit ChlI
MENSRAGLEHTPDGHHRLITVVTLSRATGSLNFPAYFQFIAAMKLCPWGGAGMYTSGALVQKPP